MAEPRWRFRGLSWVGYCGHRLYAELKTLEADVGVALAGRAAEIILTPELCRPMETSDLEDCLDILAYESEDDEPREDGIEAWVALQAANPDASEAEIIASFRQHEAAVLAMLREPDTWARVDRLARALLAHGRVGDVVAQAIARGDLDPETLQ